MAQLYDLNTIYQNAWNSALSAQAHSQATASQARGELQNPGTISFTPVAPLVPLQDHVTGYITPLASATSGMPAQADAAAQRVTQDLTALFSKFLTDHFPVDTLAGATTWINRQLSSGGAGINEVVERQIWERESDRARVAARQATEDLLATFTSRRFSIPPGAAAYQAEMLNRDAFLKQADASRERAIQTYNAELELTKFAVQSAMSLHTSAVQAANQYMQTLIFGAQHGLNTAQAVVDAQTRAAAAATAFYSAQAQLQSITVQRDLGASGLELDANKTSYNAATTMASRKADVAMEAAKMDATLAAAAMNGINTSFGYGESNDVTGIT